MGYHISSPLQFNQMHQYPSEQCEVLDLVGGSGGGGCFGGTSLAVLNDSFLALVEELK